MELLESLAISTVARCVCVYVWVLREGSTCVTGSEPMWDFQVEADTSGPAGGAGGSVV